MLRRHAAPASWTTLALAIVLGATTSACQTTMSIDEARRVAARFGAAPLAPPPRTIEDVAASLGRQAVAVPDGAAHALAGTAPPRTSRRHEELAAFYFARGRAAGRLGRPRQEIDDLTTALEHARAGLGPTHAIAAALAGAEFRGGRLARHLSHLRFAIAAVPVSQLDVLAFPDPHHAFDWRIRLHAALARSLAALGDVAAAEAEAARAASLVARSPAVETFPRRAAALAEARAAIAEAQGRHADAEALYREALEVFERDPLHRERAILPGPHWYLTRTLIRQGRLVEAEAEARQALLATLSTQGRESAEAVLIMQNLAWALLEQGRYREAEFLARTAVTVHEGLLAHRDSWVVSSAHALLGKSLALQGRDHEALFAYEYTVGRDDASRQMVLDRGLGYAEVLLATGRFDWLDRAVQTASSGVEPSRADRADDQALELRGILARVHAARGDRGAALREFQAAVPGLLARAPAALGDGTTSRAAEQRLQRTLHAYVGLLADVRGGPVEHEAGIDAAAEAFRVADAARARVVQRAIGASAARAAAASPALAELIRSEQDAEHRLAALRAALADHLSQPDAARETAAARDLKARIHLLQRARAVLRRQVEQDFPGYAELIRPTPVTLDEARALLRPDEALLATLVTRDRTFVWAVPPSGPVAFAAAPLGADALEDIVTTLRKTVQPDARTLGDIPDFDVAEAHRLFEALLAPVRAGWQHARGLVVVADGPLARLPLGLLPTRPTELPPPSGAIFSNYRAVPWLVRSHAITMVPSVAALATLRRLPPGDPARRAFVGFGDPYFSLQQAVLGDAVPRPALAALDTRAVPVVLRSSPPLLPSSRLATLPRLPDTADEIRSLAAAMRADPARDVYLGVRANEHAVKTLDLAAYRVVAFATHGLVPGDLDGLTQPALALSAPEVADVDGDGLLTMDEILGLRLNADWVVLSGCNTASGEGTGADAISGLGRAFFHAGARALLVSNWPVETTSARLLTTELFRRHQQRPGQSRARALQEAMTWLIDHGAAVDADGRTVVFSYAHPVFWAPFTLVGDSGGGAASRAR